MTSAMANLWIGLCRASYYISLLGVKIPAGLLFRASSAPRALAFISLVWVPFLCYCHVSLLPKVQHATHAVAIWHVLTALWVTIPLLVVGAVVLSRVRAVGPHAVFLGALATVAAFHSAAVPALAHTRVGAVLLQALFAFFEDMPIVMWLWCLYHVVQLQRFVRTKQAGRASPFKKHGAGDDDVLIVGNAPTVIDGPPLGKVIDAFSQVARFNSYSVAQPSHTGSKVGFHFCNGRNFPSTKSVKAVLPLFNASLTHAVYLFMPHVEETLDIVARLTSSKADAWFVEEPQILALRKKIGCRFWQIPTSGMVAINAFLEDHSSVALHGFNFFQGKKIHYFEESPTQLITSWLERFVTHDPSREKVWVASLVKGGQAKFLAEAKGMEPPREEEEEELASLHFVQERLSEREDKLLEAGAKARRRPGLLQTILRDGLPSQFSL
mmetsp:Transcript_82551/g.233865  ORF Transcript_82551/g.233865 Transcript_82551/m.233865 type:complete len:439 (-) Transcript_82551:57-1373(-)